jgi:PAS domain S-box-containing protein
MFQAPYHRQAIGGIWLLNLVVLLLAGASLYHDRQAKEQQAMVTVDNLSLALGRDVAHTLEKIDDALESLTASYDERLNHPQWDASGWNAVLHRYRQRLQEVNVLAVTDAAGNVVYGTDPGMVGRVSVADRVYFVQLRDHADRGLVISQPVLEHATKVWSVMLARRLNHKDGAFAGVVFAGLPLSALSTLAEQLQLPPGSAYAIRDADLRVIVRKPAQKGKGDIGATAISAAFQAQLQTNTEQGSYHTDIGEVDDTPRVHAYRLNAEYGFYANVGFARDAYLQNWWVECRNTGALVALFAALSALLTCQLQRSWRAEQAHQKVQRQQQKLTQAILDRAPAVIFTKNCKGHYLLVNQRFCDLMGRRSVFLLGKTDHDISPLDVADKLRANDVAVLESGNSFEFDEFVRLPDGERQFMVLKFPILDDTDAVVAVCGIATDITDRQREQVQKEADHIAQRQALVREVHHRIKNNLQGISGLLRAAGRQHPELQTYITQAVGQVQSVALIHGLQGMGQSERVRLGELLQAVAASVGALWNSTIDVELTDPLCCGLISETESVPLALVINELVVNAVKHGDTAVTGVKVRLHTDKQAGTVQIDITNGGVWQDRDLDGNMGLQLVQTLLPRSGAVLSRVCEDQRVCTTLVLKSPIIDLECEHPE